MLFPAPTAGFSVCEEDKQTSSKHECTEELLDDDLNKNQSKKKKENSKYKILKTNRNRKLERKKINRGSNKKKESELCIMSTNAAQLKGKIKSFKSELINSNAGVFTVQETHYATKGKVKIENFEIFEAIRKKVKG